MSTLDDFAALLAAEPDPGARERLMNRAKVLAMSEVPAATLEQGKFAKAVRASDVKPVRISWAWNGFIPLGALSLLYGHEGLGKSALSVMVAAMATRGTLPGALKGKPCDVGIVAYEDDPGAVLVPRLLAAGADLDRVWFHGHEDSDDPLTLPDDVEQLGAWIEGTGCRLLIVDPLPDALREGLKDNNNGDVRKAIVPLNALAGRLGVAVLGVTHPNKGQTDAANKVMGSKAWRSVPRSVMLFGHDPDEPSGDTRLVAVSKANYAAKRAVKVRVNSADVEGAGSQPRVEVVGASDYTDDDVLVAGSGGRPVSGGKPVERAERLIMRLLEDSGGEVKAKVAYAAGEAEGLPEATLRRAREGLGVEGGPTWRMPDDQLPVT